MCTLYTIVAALVIVYGDWTAKSYEFGWASCITLCFLTDSTCYDTDIYTVRSAGILHVYANACSGIVFWHTFCKQCDGIALLLLRPLCKQRVMLYTLGIA